MIRISMKFFSHAQTCSKDLICECPRDCIVCSCLNTCLCCLAATCCSRQSLTTAATHIDCCIQRSAKVDVSAASFQAKLHAWRAHCPDASVYTKAIMLGCSFTERAVGQCYSCDHCSKLLVHCPYPVFTSETTFGDHQPATVMESTHASSSLSSPRFKMLGTCLPRVEK